MRCPEPRAGLQISRRAHKEKHKGISATPDNKAASMGAQLKFLYANTHSMKNKQEKLVHAYTSRAVISLESWRCGGMTSVTGVSEWNDTGSLRTARNGCCSALWRPWQEGWN